MFFQTLIKMMDGIDVEAAREPLGTGETDCLEGVVEEAELGLVHPQPDQGDGYEGTDDGHVEESAVGIDAADGAVDHGGEEEGSDDAGGTVPRAKYMVFRMA